jgi:transcriptional regulator with XRE-family HTH domain
VYRHLSGAVSPVDRESPRATAAPRLAVLAAWLRSGIDNAVAAPGRNRRWLARRAGIARSTLALAESGRTMPSWAVTSDVVEACGLDAEDAARLWREARSESEGRVLPADPSGVTTAAEFAEELRVVLLQEAGVAGIRKIAEATGLSRSTVHRVLNGVRPPSTAQLAALLKPCGLAPGEWQPWVVTRARLARPDVTWVPDAAPGPAVAPGPALAPAHPVAHLVRLVHEEVKELGRGRGLRQQAIAIGATMGEVCGINPDADPGERRARLLDALAVATADLPLHDAWLVRSSLNIASGQDALGEKPPLWGDSTDLMFVNHDLHRDARTVRRDVDRAQWMVADSLVTRFLRDRWGGEGDAWSAAGSA